jgi:predicted phage tail protein
MRAITSERLGLWIRATGIVALVALAWAVFAPDGPFWTAVLAAGLMGAVLATAGLARSRRHPSLRQVITSAEAEPVVARIGE